MKMNKETKIKLEIMDANGPVEKEVTVDEAVQIIVEEKRNNKMVFINGSPYMKDVILKDEVSKAKSITIANQLIGG